MVGAESFGRVLEPKIVAEATANPLFDARVAADVEPACVKVVTPPHRINGVVIGSEAEVIAAHGQRSTDAVSNVMLFVFPCYIIFWLAYLYPCLLCNIISKSG